MAQKLTSRQKRKRRIRKKLAGTPARPRLTVYRSLNNIYAQAIDDENSTTIASASTLDKELKGNLGELDKTGAAKKVGELVAKRILAKDVTAVVFDRNGVTYHGRIAALADAAREAGLKF